MQTASQIVVSASRRTDIPAFYMPWMMEQIQNGAFNVVNPYNRKKTVVSASPEKIHTIVFWSKNFGPFLQGRYGERLVKAGYHLFFNFTVNSHSPMLEPRLPPLRQRLDQMAQLSERFGPGSIHWRFDPIVFYRSAGAGRNNLADFDKIAQTAAACGISRCITSFLDLYAKVRRRCKDIELLTPSLAEQKNVISELAEKLSGSGIMLRLCCEPALLAQLPPEPAVEPGACIPNDLLIQLYGPGISRKKDAGQRPGCGCRVSIDIGVYHQHPCYHRCRYCYANPATDQQLIAWRQTAGKKSAGGGAG